MAKYVDGFVLVVPKDQIKEYQKMAEMGKEMWMKYGALEYMECMGEDLNPKEMGGMMSLAFTELAKAEPNETVWFSFIVFESKERRDEINAKVMEEMSKQAEEYKDVSMPFDMRRMAVGGFEVRVEG
ncbi:MAG: hypothetical protein QG670_2095 [Thermoproteota archaeon]|nr:hypothetical protein [Thermoproteota archaeon]